MPSSIFLPISHTNSEPAYLILGPLEEACLSQAAFYYKKYLDLVHRNSLRLLRLINQLMDFRKIEETK